MIRPNGAAAKDVALFLIACLVLVSASYGREVAGEGLIGCIYHSL